MATVNNVQSQAGDLIKMEQYSTASNQSTSGGKLLSTVSPSSSAAPSTSSLSGLDLFGHIVEAIPTAIPTVVECINNGDLDIESSKECELWKVTSQFNSTFQLN